MTQAEALVKWNQLTASRLAPVVEEPTPMLDNIVKLRRIMTELQGTLCDMNVPNRMELTLGDITTLLRMCNV